MAQAELGEWRALSPPEAARLLDGMPCRWWVAGGWAIDLFLGKETRGHADLDISVLRGDEEIIRSHLAGWDLHIAHDGALTPWGDQSLDRPLHQFWARPSPTEPWALEVLLEDHDGDEWCYRRNHDVRLPLEHFGRQSPDGVPFVAPEVALRYKARHLDVERNVADFEVALPALGPAARGWLRDALRLLRPDHSWLGRL